MSMDMYREYILQHYRRPRNYGSLDAPDFTHEDDNPLCGDEIRIEVKVDENNIAEIGFQGKGCAICMASTSILTGKVKGRDLDEVKALNKDDLLGWLRIPVSPMRLKCALLGMMVLQAGIHEYQKSAGATEQSSGSAPAPESNGLPVRSQDLQRGPEN
ncbi:MAG: iron-sulfur cluster assembly scaffold protein [Thermaerobacterales bacterium]